MQQDADFITAEFLYIRASCAHHQEYKILTRQPLVQVVMVAGGSSLLSLTVKFRPQHGEVKIHLQPKLPVPVAAVSVFYTPDDGRMTAETCRESLH